MMDKERDGLWIMHESKSQEDIWKLFEKIATEQRIADIEKSLQELSVLEASIIQKQAELEKELKDLEEK